jgi:phage recombination protein Bet
MSNLFQANQPKPTKTAEKVAAPDLTPVETVNPPAVIEAAPVEEIPRREWSSADMELAKATFFRAWPQDAQAERRRNPHEPYQWELDLYLYRCRIQGQDPMLNDLYVIWRWDARKRDHAMSIQTSIDGYRKVAERTRRYAGSDEPVFATDERGAILSCTQTVYKLLGGVRCAFTAIAYMAEYNPNMGLWGKMPHGQLAKCAEALALRKAFPDALSGTYTDVEMMQADAPPPKENPATDPSQPVTAPRAERQMPNTLDKLKMEWKKKHAPHERDANMLKVAFQGWVNGLWAEDAKFRDANADPDTCEANNPAWWTCISLGMALKKLSEERT